MDILSTDSVGCFHNPDSFEKKTISLSMSQTLKFKKFLELNRLKRDAPTNYARSCQDDKILGVCHGYHGDHSMVIIVG